MVYSHTVGGVHSTHSPGGAVETETGEGEPSVEREKRVHISQDYSMEQPPHSVYQYRELYHILHRVYQYIHMYMYII